MNTRDNNSLQRFALKFEFQEDITELSESLQRLRHAKTKLNLRRNKKLKRS